MSKICSTCGVDKPLDEFHRDASRKDGHRNNCKQCSVHNKAYREQILSVTEKTCQFCKEVKPLERFLRDKRRTLGYGVKCLDCAQAKLCRKCQVVKPLSAYSPGDRSADGYRYTCKECDNERLRAKYADDPLPKRLQNARWYYKKESREGRRERMLMKNYGMTLYDYEALMDLQDHRCRICRHKEGERGRGVLTVDHCHKTGVIRGLLCDPCNRALGMFLESPEVLRAAIEYLETSGAMHAHFG